MSAPEKQQRIAKRTPLRSAVWMKPSDDSSSMVGETRNVSASGMFVNVVPTPKLGQEVVCELPGHEAVRGRVVWVSMPPDLADHGVGIEFVDLTKQSEGPTYAGVDLAGPLDFLQAGSEVHVGKSADGRALRARVAHVEMRSDSMISLSLVLMPQAAPKESWFPDIDIDAPISAAVPPASAPISLELGSMELPAIVERDEELASLAELITAPALPNVPVTVMPSDVEPEELAHLDHTERTLLVSEVAEPAPQPSRSLAPLAVVAGIVLAGLVILRVGFPSHPEVAPLPAPIVAEPVAAAPVVAAPVAVAPVAAAPVAAAPVVAAHIAAEPAAPAKVVDPALWHPEIVTVAGQPAVIVPVGGSDKGMSHFVLDKPQGIAVDLPNAKAATPVKSWLLHHGSFDSLWVRQMPAGGLQIRLHVQKGVHVKATFVDGALQIVKQ